MDRRLSTTTSTRGLGPNPGPIYYNAASSLAAPISVTVTERSRENPGNS
jgi:hypothetical protein